MTPTEAEGHERSRKFREAIAQKAADLQKPKRFPPLTAPLPPISNEDFAAAAEIAFPSYVGTVRRIQRAVCQHYGCSLNELLSSQRSADIVRPRQVGYYLSIKLTRRSLNEIGRQFGDRDHTSILSGMRKIERLRQQDPKVDADVRAVAAMIGGELE